MRNTISFLLLAIAFSGCKARIDFPEFSKEIAPTNVAFKPLFREPISLSSQQTKTLQTMLARFNNPREVREQSTVHSAAEGFFLYGNVSLSWSGSAIFYYNPKSGKKVYVEDAHLQAMWDKFIQLEQGPLEKTYPTNEEQWKLILGKLD